MSELVHATFDAHIDHIDHLYDGDTVNKVFFRLPGIEPADGCRLGEIYPDFFLQSDGLWVHINVRIAGIDCPERHPHHKYPDGTLRDVDEIEREHEAAMEAREVVADLLMKNDLQFLIRNPQLGKYAERVVAEVWLRDPEKDECISVGERLLDKGLAYAYEGGKKRVWGKHGA